MKQLDSPHPLLLLCTGYPGAGKSTFARQLAETQGFAWIHANRLRHILFTAPSFSSNEESLVDQLAEYMLGEALRTRGHIVFDATAATSVARQKLAKLGRDAGYTVLVVWVQTDLQTAFSRAKRARPEEFATALSRSQFDALVAQFAKPSHNEIGVVLSGKHTFPTQLRTLIRKIDLLLHPQPIPPASKPKRIVPVNDVHPKAVPPTPPPERSRPRFDITRRIKFR